MKFNKYIFTLLAISLSIALLSCKTIPPGATAVTSFEKEKYLGKWYEIARLDFSFERNLDNTTAEYSLTKNGTINVLNKGYNTKKEKWEEAQGKAKFVQDEKTGMLKVSFFGPFYGGYNVIAIDDDYNYALVAGSSLDYLWILSRETTIPEDVKQKYLKLAESIGYKTADLLWISHDKAESN